MSAKSDEGRAERPDDDNPEWTRTMFRNARPGADVLPGLIGEGAAAELTKAKGGRPRSEDPSVAVTLRIRRSSVEAYRQAGGDKWRKLAEKTLQDHAPGRK